MTFEQKLRQSVSESSSVLCVGLDPLIERIPEAVKKNLKSSDEIVFQFLRDVVDATHKYCCAYKPNLAFFEALGVRGLDVFKRIVDYIPKNKIIIADAKRGDIGHTAASYKKAYFDNFNVDAITLSPFMGFETLESFLDDDSKGIYVLTLTSNEGAKDFLLKPFDGHDRMSDYIAKHLQTLHSKFPGHAGMVIGATKTEILTEVIEKHPQASLLIPGIGAQGGSIEDLANALSSHKGIPIINSSRSVIFAGKGKDWKSDVEKAAASLQTKLKTIIDRYV